MKRALTIALMSLALSGMYVSPSQANCMDDVHQMRDDLAKWRYMYTVDGTYIKAVGDPVPGTGSRCLAFGYGKKKPSPYFLEWVPGNVCNTLRAF